MPRITISYRRDDSGVITGRIFDRLAAHYGRESVFRDIDNIPPGVDFRKHINEMLDASDIVLAIVGPKWVGPRANQSRLANAADPVRIEIETALRKDRPLIPVLVQRASMPRVDQLPESMQDFAYRNAVDVDPGRDFDHHINGLIRAMDRILRDSAEPTDAVEGAAPETSAGDSMLGQDELPAPNAEVAAEVETLRGNNQALEKQIAELTRARDELARQAAGLSHEVADILRAKEEEVASLTRQLAATRDTATARGQRAEEAANKLQERERRIAALTTELASLQRNGNSPARLKSYRIALVIMMLLLVGAVIAFGSSQQRPTSEQIAQKDAKIAELNNNLSTTQDRLSVASAAVINRDSKIASLENRMNPVTSSPAPGIFTGSANLTNGRVTIENVRQGQFTQRAVGVVAVNGVPELELGDIITAVNALPTRNKLEFKKVIDLVSSLPKVTLNVTRNGTEIGRTVPVRVFQ